MHQVQGVKIMPQVKDFKSRTEDEMKLQAGLKGRLKYISGRDNSSARVLSESCRRSFSEVKRRFWRRDILELAVRSNVLDMSRYQRFFKEKKVSEKYTKA